jgi:hypothetical protein
MRSVRSAAGVSIVAGIVTLAGAGVAYACFPSRTAAEDTQPGSSDQLRTTLTTCAGKHAPAVVRPGQCLDISAYGFEPKEPVSAWLVSSASRVTSLVADHGGRLTWRVTVAPIVGGHEVAAFVGQGRAHGQPGAPGNVTVTVPRIAIARYTVKPKQDHDDHGGHPNDHGEQPADD